MTVLLRQPRDLPDASRYSKWVSLGSELPGLPPERQVVEVDSTLERAFEAVSSEWIALGRQLGAEPSGELSHACACVANASDFGLMLAWTRLIKDWAAAPETILVVCDDPWMFRHLSLEPGVMAGTKPCLLPRVAQHALRGFLARAWRALVLATEALRQRPDQRRSAIGGPALLVYGHPGSDAVGRDAYFGDLMKSFPRLRRILHVDCPSERARILAGPTGRTLSLHGWGNPLFALSLVMTRWRPGQKARRGPYGWLIRRAAALEGGTAQAMVIGWQNHCQARWVRHTRPTSVLWPWENHAWERTLVRCLRTNGVRSTGYQHSVVGRHMLNYSCVANSDGIRSIPDSIFCSGHATLDQLVAFGLPEGRAKIGGALRFADVRMPRFDPTAPIFVALPFDRETAFEMVEAAKAASTQGFRFLVKDHPMFPFTFAESEAVQHCTVPFSEQEGLSAVVFAATTVGLEAILAGLPTLRFRPRNRIALDILPRNIHTPTVNARSLPDTLRRVSTPSCVEREHIFGSINVPLWQDAIEAERLASS